MYGFIGNLGPWELGLILVIILIIFGPGQLPKVGESIGKAIRGFRDARAQEGEEAEQTK